MKTPLLELDLIPKTCFYKNVRALVSKEQWDIIRKFVSSKVYNMCEICGETGPYGRLDCHEKWYYDEQNLIQKLIGMIALCSNCHLCKHFGFAQIQGKKQQAFDHLMKVNSWTENKTNKYLKKTFKQWSERSTKKWKLDVSFLQEYGINIESLMKNK